jgi:hypothetical protein
LASFIWDSCGWLCEEDPQTDISCSILTSPISCHSRHNIRIKTKNRKSQLGERRSMHPLPDSKSTYTMMMRGGMCDSLSIKKVMRRKHLCLHHVLIIVIKNEPGVFCMSLSNTYNNRSVFLKCCFSVILLVPEA